MKKLLSDIGHITIGIAIMALAVMADIYDKVRGK